jgi:protein-S-isoprenylcysteine O-methyltransferase Ste14
MSVPKGKSYDEVSRSRDNIKRGIKEPSAIGTACFVGSRTLDPFLQYGILAKGYGSNAIEKLGGRVLPQGPALITNTPLDSLLGLSPYRSIIFGMSVGSMLKQNIHCATIMQEQMPPQTGLFVGAFNAVFNSLNSLFFVCAQTSASTNGEHFPQTPLIVGSSLYVLGMALEFGSEIQRHAFKKDPKNKGQVYEGGLFGLSRHINYFGYTLWRTGYALAAGGWMWGAATAAFFVYDFNFRGIPVLQHYLEERVSRWCELPSWTTLTMDSMVTSTSTTRPRCRTGLCRTCTRLLSWLPMCLICCGDSRCNCCVNSDYEMCVNTLTCRLCICNVLVNVSLKLWSSLMVISSPPVCHDTPSFTQRAFRECCDTAPNALHKHHSSA